MAVRKPKAVETPKERAARDRVARARAKDPRWDATGAYLERCVELARSVGADIEAVIDEHWERSAVRHYDGAMSIDDAERLAFDDVRERFERQGRLSCAP